MYIYIYSLKKISEWYHVIVVVAFIVCFVPIPVSPQRWFMSHYVMQMFGMLLGGRASPFRK